MIPKCASAASSCSAKVPAPRPTSSNSSAWRSARQAALATASTRARRMPPSRAWSGASAGAGGFGRSIDPRGAHAALEGLFGPERRIELGWLVEGDQLPKGAVKLLLNLGLLAGDALVRGGRLDIGAEVSDDVIELVIRAEGPRILLDPA